MWLFGAAKKLRRLGIMGMNRRNAAFILDHNDRAKYPIVDDKLRMRDLCVRIGVPTPAIHATITCPWMLGRLTGVLSGLSDFVVKPNRGSGGRGILVIVGQEGGRFIRHNGQPISPDELRQHVSDVLSGMHSLGGQPDHALIQQRVRMHPAFKPISFKGIPDIRVVVYRNEPAMAMLRLPTQASAGRANLHQGGIGAGVDLETGRTNNAVLGQHFTYYHPDTDMPLVGFQVPYWPRVLEMSRQAAAAVGMGYVGVDIVIDAAAGPMLLEANARPGLAIQLANGQGLLPRLAAIDRGEKPPVPIATPDEPEQILPIRKPLAPALPRRKSA